MISAPETDVYALAYLAHPQIRKHNNGNGTRLPGASAQITSSSLPHSRTLHYKATINGSDQTQSDTFEGELDFSSSEGVQFRTQSTDDQKSFIIPTIFVNSNAGYSDTTIGQLIIHKLDHELLEILRQINPQIETIAAGDNAVYVDIGLDKMIPLNMFGSGMARAAHVFSRCILGELRVLLIDEIENSLHHEGLLVFLEALLSVVAKRDIQVFATTHSLELLKILQGVLRRDTYSDMRSESKCIVLARNSDGDVRPYKYDYEEFDHCIQHGIEIR